MLLKRFLSKLNQVVMHTNVISNVSQELSNSSQEQQ